MLTDYTGKIVDEIIECLEALSYERQLQGKDIFIVNDDSPIFNNYDIFKIICRETGIEEDSPEERTIHDNADKINSKNYEDLPYEAIKSYSFTKPWSKNFSYKIPYTVGTPIHFPPTAININGVNLEQELSLIKNADKAPATAPIVFCQETGTIEYNKKIYKPQVKACMMYCIKELFSNPEKRLKERDIRCHDDRYNQNYNGRDERYVENAIRHFNEMINEKFGFNDKLFIYSGKREEIEPPKTVRVNEKYRDSLITVSKKINS